MRIVDVLSTAVLETAMHVQKISWPVYVTHPTILIQSCNFHFHNVGVHSVCFLFYAFLMYSTKTLSPHIMAVVNISHKFSILLH